MKVVAHLSDLHFDVVDRRIARNLVADLQALKPDLVVVSGDLTQRARSGQYRRARSFLQQLPQPQIVAPGNHDIPLFHLFRRFFRPLTRYRTYIEDELMPLYADEELAVLGVNTARSLTRKEGRLSVEQIRRLRQIFCTLPNAPFKVVVTHHPFIPPSDDVGIRLVGRSRRALVAIEACGVDLLLAGHLHRGYSGDVRTFHPTTRRSIIVVQAGTAISDRRRREPNGYNLLSISGDRILVAVRRWTGECFKHALRTQYRCLAGEWVCDGTRRCGDAAR